MKPVKTCVYAIALNEIKFVDKFMEHCREADLVLVCDTGSTDGTAERLRELGATVYNIVQRPWRFDVPRNTALSLIPEDIDICLSIDLDEFLQPGWHDAINDAWQAHNGQLNRIAYDYIWNWCEDGVTPDIRFFADKIHHRQNYRWRHPCHETLYYEGPENEIRITVPKVILHHRADPTKSRGQYLGLLKTAAYEDPENDRMRHYYARELMFTAQYQEAIKEFEIHLGLQKAQWKEERAASMRFIARCYNYLGRPSESMAWATKATIEWPWSRETWLELARVSNAAKDWHTCFYAAGKCLDIKERTMSYIGDGACWGHEPYDLAALSAYYLELHSKAVDYGTKALSFEPNNDRLAKNLEFYRERIQ